MVQNTSRKSFWEACCTVVRSTPVSASARATEQFRQNGAFMRMADAIRGGITRKTLYAMRDAGQIEQLTRGPYRLADCHL